MDTCSYTLKGVIFEDVKIKFFSDVSDSRWSQYSQDLKIFVSDYWSRIDKVLLGK